MQRSTRFNRPTLRGSSIASLLFGKQESFVLKAGPDTTTSTSLTWTQPNYKPDNYRVERSTNGISFSTVATVSDSTLDYNDTGLTESTQYWYRIVPILGGADQSPSNVADTWTVPSTPTTLTATAVGGTQIDLTWVDVSTGNTGQIIERRTPSGSGSYSLLATVSATATTYSDTGLTPGQSYEYRVAATNPATLSAYSNTASATPSATPTAAWTLDFSSGEPWANGTNYVFSSTASTSRTFVNSSGYVAPCVANLLQRSEDLANAAWTKTRVSITANDSTAPDGTTTADRIVEDTANNFRGVDSNNTSSLAAGGNRCWSIYVKKPSTNGRSIVGIAVEDGGNGYFGKRFDLDAGTAVGADYNTNTTNITNLAFGIVNVGSGWYRCWVSARSANAGACDGRVSPMLSSTSAFFAGLADTYQGDGVSGILAWGGQFEEASTPSPYSATTTSSNGIPRLTHDKNGSRLGLLIEESRTNILTQSENLSTSWGGGDTNVTTDAVSAPDNATTADKLAATTATAAHWRRINTTSPTAGTTYVFSCFFKVGGGAVTHVYLGMETSGTAARDYVVKYDATTGARTDIDSGGTPVNTDSATQAEDMGNGWWRAWVRMEHSTGNTTLRAYVGLATAATGAKFPSFTGAAADADFAYFWGAQVEASTNVPTSYLATTGSTVTRSADLVHVLDSTITGWQDPGALVVHFYPPGQAGTLISTDDAATAQVGIEASTTTAARAFWSSGSTATGTIGSGVQKAVHYWNGSTSKFCINGGTVQSGTNNLTIANTDFVTLGAEATDSSGVPGTFSQYANCIIRKVEFYSGTLTDANLQTITT